jgi:MFS transporter, ACS family, D-galactonate transporter
MDATTGRQDAERTPREREVMTQVRPRGNLRWGVALLLGAGILINYFDRVNISVATKPLIADFHLTTAQFGIVLSAFGWSYALLQIPVGTLLDKIGIKWLNRIGTALWTLATFMTAAVSGLGLLILARVILGVAEAPAFPGASKATGYWFPLRERGLATSSFDAAAKFSNVIGVPIVALAVTQGGWQAGFILTGILSLLYTVAWWLFYNDPSRMRRLRASERQYIVQGGAQPEGAATASTFISLGYLLRQRKVWGLTLGFAAYG